MMNLVILRFHHLPLSLLKEGIGLLSSLEGGLRRVKIS
jgi:hypothetical protein